MMLLTSWCHDGDSHADGQSGEDGLPSNMFMSCRNGELGIGDGVPCNMCHMEHVYGCDIASITMIQSMS